MTDIVPAQQISDSADRIVVLLNRKAGAGSGETKVGNLIAFLERHPYTVDVMDDPAQMASSANRYHEAGTLRCVVAAGGDGTVKLVASLTEPGVPIAVLPMGTENLLAKHFRLAFDPQPVYHGIRHGRTLCVDAGLAGDRLFLIMLSCGFDAEVVRRLDASRRGNIKHMAYAKPIISTILNYTYPEIRLYCREHPEADTEREIVSHWAFVFNLPIYAAGLRIMRGGNSTDGLLDIRTFRGGSFWHGLYHLSSVVLGGDRPWKNSVIAQASSLRIESEGSEVPYQLDGDPGGLLPVKVQVISRRVTIVVPPTPGIGNP